MSEIKDRIYKTKSARFNAHERLLLQYKLANYTIMLLSVYIVVLSIAPKYLNRNIPFSEIISIGLSAFVIGISSFEAGNDRLTMAHALYKNALDINALYDRALKQSDTGEISKEYHDILSTCNYNHSGIDHYWHILGNNQVNMAQRIHTFICFLPAFLSIKIIDSITPSSISWGYFS